MRKILLVLTAFICFQIAEAQEKGVHFENTLSWNEIKAKALAENKYIFVDCYTTWCGPCKFMSLHIFPLEEVGKVVNEKFVCVSIQMDTTNSDDENVKSWYKDAQALAKEYGVNSYPSFLFFSPSGKALHKATGRSRDSADFIATINSALNEDKQYFRLMTEYKEHLHDSSFLSNAIQAAMKLQDWKNCSKITDAYIDCIKSPFNKTNLQLIAQTIDSSRDKGFQLFLSHTAEVDTALGVNSANEKLINVMWVEEINPILKGSSVVNWEREYDRLRKKYPVQAEQIIAKVKWQYYRRRKMWKEYGQALVFYMDKYGAIEYFGDAFKLNGYAWDIYLHCTDRSVLDRALGWGLRIQIDSKKVPLHQFCDTYASLLYKTGDVKGAITWEEKAKSIVDANNETDASKQYAQKIADMHKGEKIWEHEK